MFSARELSDVSLKGVRVLRFSVWDRTSAVMTKTWQRTPQLIHNLRWCGGTVKCVWESRSLWLCDLTEARLRVTSFSPLQMLSGDGRGVAWEAGLQQRQPQQRRGVEHPIPISTTFTHGKLIHESFKSFSTYSTWQQGLKMAFFKINSAVKRVQRFWCRIKCISSPYSGGSGKANFLVSYQKSTICKTSRQYNGCLQRTAEWKWYPVVVECNLTTAY